MAKRGVRVGVREASSKRHGKGHTWVQYSWNRGKPRGRAPARGPDQAGSKRQTEVE